MYNDVIILSPDDFFAAYGPCVVSELLRRNNISSQIINCADKIVFDQAKEILDRFLINENQILAISTTFLRSFHSQQRIREICAYAKSKFPNIKIVVGGANNSPITNLFPSPNTTFLLGQNRENEIIAKFCAMLEKPQIYTFEYKSFYVDYSYIYRSDQNPPKGIIQFLDVSRGCLFNCSFCNFNLRNTKTPILKDKEALRKEIESFNKIFNGTQIAFTCNTFNDHQEKLQLLDEVFSELPYTPQCFAFTRTDLMARQPEFVKLFYKKYIRFIFFGIESLYPPSLKAINKSGNVELIKSFLKEFRQKYADPETVIVAAQIIGLPHDTFETNYEMIKWLFDEDVVDRYAIQPLRIMPPSRAIPGMNEFSEIDMFPEKFGYTILPSGSLPHATEEQLAALKKFNIDLSINSSDYVHWERADGVNSISALVDAYRLQSSVHDVLNYDVNMMMKNRGVNSNLKHRFTRQDVVPAFIIGKDVWFQPSNDTFIRDIFKEAEKFLDEYYAYLLRIAPTGN